MDRLAALVDRADCVDVIARVARALDRCDAALMATLFHPDATDDHGMFHGTAAEFIAWVFPLLATMTRTQHVLGQVLVALSGDTARSEAYFVAYHAVPKPDGGAAFVIAAGRYLDRLERRDGVWKIAHRHAVYDWSQSAPSTDSWNRTGGMPGWVFGERGTGDASYRHFTGHTPV